MRGNVSFLILKVRSDHTISAVFLFQQFSFILTYFVLFLGITGPIKSSEPHSSIKTSPIPNKPSLVRTSSARNQSNARNAPQQTTVTSIYQAQHQSQSDFDSDTYSSRSSLISRESSASTIIPDLNDIINAPPNQTNSFHSFNSTAPVYQNPPSQQSYSPNALARHTHPVTSIGTPTTSQTVQISPIKGLSSNSNSPHVPGSPSLSKNIQKKLLGKQNTVLLRIFNRVFFDKSFDRYISKNLQKTPNKLRFLDV